MNFIELVRDAKLELWFMTGSGLGAVLLAIVVIAVVLIVSPKISNLDVSTIISAWKTKPQIENKPQSNLLDAPTSDTIKR